MKLHSLCSAFALTLFLGSATTLLAAQPVTAPADPTVSADLVEAIYSDTYTSACGYSFGEWGGGYVETENDIDGNHYRLYTGGNFGYFGLQFNQDINATAMLYLHLDIWADEDMTAEIYPIYGGTEYNKVVSLSAQQWNSITLTLATDYASITSWGRVYQIKLAGLGNKTIALDNVYFYRDPIEDTTAPTAVSASVKTASYFSLDLLCQATDENGVVNFDVYLDSTKVATSGGVSGEGVTVHVPNLQPSQAYTFSVVASDANGNEAAPVLVTGSTLSSPAPAPVPERAAENVYSIYSDAYASPTFFIIGSWGQSTSAVEALLADNDHAYLCTSFNYLGLEINNNAGIDVAQYPFLHIDLYPVDATALSITPISAGKEGSYTMNLTPGQWNSMDIDLTPFEQVNRAALIQIKMMNATPEGSTLFFDNVYFYQEPVEPSAVENVELDFTVSVTNRVLHIESALPLSCLSVYTPAGALVSTQNDCLLSSGLYLVQVNNQTARVLIP